jgi:hypothetical protein
MTNYIAQRGYQNFKMGDPISDAELKEAIKTLRQILDPILTTDVLICLKIKFAWTSTVWRICKKQGKVKAK